MSSLLIPISILSASSLVILSSISTHLFLMQFLWLVTGMGIFFILPAFDWRSFINYRWAMFGIYGFSIALLILTYFFAPSIRGAESWLVFGPIQIQTAELAKAALILILAHFFAKRHTRIALPRTLFSSFLLFCVPTALILLQPDLGSALVFFGIWIGFLLVSGIRMRHLAIIVVLSAILSAGGWQYVLEDYQKERIMGLFFPAHDQLGINYNVIQSKIAIGSAGLFGKGYGGGTQVQLGFLPEPATDFVLAAFIEEWGLVGGLLILAAFFALIFAILRVGVFASNNFEKFICLGTAILIMIHVFINTGSATGITPVIGIPFPFLSYGGSNLLTVFLLVGIIHSIEKRR